jgi:hypothetical protein
MSFCPSLPPFLTPSSLTPATPTCSKPLEAVLTKPVYLTILLVGGLVFIAWGVMAFRSAAGDAFSFHATTDGHGLTVQTAGGVWFAANVLRLRALELRNSGAAPGTVSITSLGLLRDGCPITPGALGDAGARQ